MAIVNENFNKLSGDWFAQSQSLKKALQDLSQVRGEHGALEILLTAEEAKVKLKDFVIEGCQRDLKATGENFDVMMHERDRLLVRLKEADADREGLQKKHDDVAHQLTEREADAVQLKASLAEKVDENLKLVETLNTIQADFLANMRDYNDLVVSGPHLHPGFEAEDVHTWAREHPEEAMEIRDREEAETEEEGELSGEATIVVDDDFSVADQDNNNVVDSLSAEDVVPSPPLNVPEEPSIILNEPEKSSTPPPPT